MFVRSACTLHLYTTTLFIFRACPPSVRRLHAQQMEVWLAQVLSLKHKRGGGLASSHYGARAKGPPTSVSEDRVSERVGGYIRVAVSRHGTC